ncbi:F-box protein At1g67340-like [Typha angustifolia]|uniref:F-box protein At1g67340-like n=1 Tax=Typha angustifolia TaxID=59011 RepID=UPI003C2DCB2A
MRTRTGLRYPNPAMAWDSNPRGRMKKNKRARCELGEEEVSESKKARVDFFDGLPDDLVISILCKLSSSASSPSDLVSILLTCKRFNELGVNPLVLARASARSIAVKANKWSESAHRFLKRCADAGNLEACYFLGMIRFYCLENRGSGASLMARAAIGCHGAALYSLAVIQFNGSGGSKDDKDLRAGAALCVRAAAVGHVDALRELGHCLQDGYGVRRNIAEGRRLLVHANARELAAASPSHAARPPCCSLLSDFGCHVAAEGDAANRFMVEWFKSRWGSMGGGEGGLRLCSHVGCGRPETRRHEFRRCSVCGAVNYCSRACQALHWKMVHKEECSPMERWIDGGGGEMGDGNGNDNEMN